ncbi:MREG protein, partial [Polyodon spathula]|nr:MREG protein [Polyodon spathula]
SETLQYFDREAKRRRAEETNLWSEPLDKSHMERDDDRNLYNLLQRRAKTRRGSQGYRRLSIDIHGKRQVRRDVKERWKMILENLGEGGSEHCDAREGGSEHCDARDGERDINNAVPVDWYWTGGDGFGASIPFSAPQDRLLILDAAEDFVGKARLYYPKEESPQDEGEAEPENTTPILVAQTNQLTPGEEEEELEGGSVEMDDDVFMSNSLE